MPVEVTPGRAMLFTPPGLGMLGNAEVAENAPVLRLRAPPVVLLMVTLATSRVPKFVPEMAVVPLPAVKPLRVLPEFKVTATPEEEIVGAVPAVTKVNPLTVSVVP